MRQDTAHGQADPGVQLDVPASAGFGGGTIRYRRRPYGVVSLSPGFTENASAIQYWGPYLASQGFVTITINTTSRLITPRSARPGSSRRSST